MLQDEIIVTLENELEVEVTEVLNLDLALNLYPDVHTSVNLTPNAHSVYLDLETLSLDEGVATVKYGRVGRIFNFIKSVTSRKTTFAKSTFTITNTIQTVGTAYIDPGNHNLLSIPITFVKNVSGHKTTFGQTSLSVINSIQTAGISSLENIDFYGDGLYGEGLYGLSSGYGSGVYGFGLYSGSSISLPIRFGSTLSGAVPIKETSVAEISLASHGTPYLRTNHSIKVRARTTSGSTGVLKAALYEGTTNRSGDLSTTLLTNSLVDYTLNISDLAAASITDYSNLSIKFWGFDSAGNILVFEVANIYLELPIGSANTTHYGAVSSSITFTKSVSGSINSKRTETAEISLASHNIPSTRTNHSIKVRARTTSGSTGVLKAALYEGANNRSGDLITEPLTNSLADYTLVILNSAAATITDYSNLSIKFWGFDISGSALVFEVSKIYLELPTGSGTTHYGAISRVTTFTKAVAGVINSKRTSTAEISLASHGTPSVRTNHSIKVRARTTSGSTGVLKAELYEGTTLRSGGTLTTSALTNSLADYTLAIPNDSAATITSYADLSIKFWGFDSAGNSLVFEVSKIYLELPAP
jgi:hypothetical protein